MKHFSILKDEEYNNVVFYVVKNKNHVVATCSIKADANRISILLNFLEKQKQLKKDEKKILRELVI